MKANAEYERIEFAKKRFGSIEPCWVTHSPITKGLPAAQAVNTADYVSYQDGAVVSREIVKRPTCTVTLFAFDEGQELSEHTAPFDALVQALEGEAEIMVSGQPHRAQRGEMILMPAVNRTRSGPSKGSRWC